MGKVILCANFSCECCREQLAWTCPGSHLHSWTTCILPGQILQTLGLAAPCRPRPPPACTLPASPRPRPCQVCPHPCGKHEMSLLITFDGWPTAEKKPQTAVWELMWLGACSRSPVSPHQSRLYGLVMSTGSMCFALDQAVSSQQQSITQAESKLLASISLYKPTLMLGFGPHVLVSEDIGRRQDVRLVS